MPPVPTMLKLDGYTNVKHRNEGNSFARDRNRATPFEIFAFNLELPFKVSRRWQCRGSIGATGGEDGAYCL